MAERVEKKTPAAEPGADDLEILHPEREVTIAGRRLVVREYGFIEGLRLLPLADPLIEDLRAHLEEGHPWSVQAVHALLGRHAETVAQLMAVAADVEPEWIDRHARHAAGTELMFWWWTVNGPFYMRCATDRAKAAMALKAQALAAQRAGRTSTPPSSPPATETPAPSAG